MKFFGKSQAAFRESPLAQQDRTYMRGKPKLCTNRSIDMIFAALLRQVALPVMIFGFENIS